jgi:hypothetical protein
MNYCGFLEKKSSSYSLLSSSWTLYWFVFAKGLLRYYSDETETKLIGEYCIDDSFIVQVLPQRRNSWPDSDKSGPTREHLFEIKHNVNQTLMVLSCPNVATIESWIIALLQVINGTIRDSENFYTGLSRDGIFSPIFQPLHDNPEITSVYQLNPSGSLSEPTLPPLPTEPLIGKFMKRSLHKNIWKERWIVLHRQEIYLYASQQDAIDSTQGDPTHLSNGRQHPSPSQARNRGNRRLFIGSKVALLPYGFENQRYCFALITFSPLATLVTLRLSCEGLEQMELWMRSLKVGILHLLLLQEKRLMSSPLIHLPDEQMNEEENERNHHKGTGGSRDHEEEENEEEEGERFPYRQTSVTVSSAPRSTFKVSNSTSLRPIRSMLHLLTSSFTSHLHPPSLVLDFFTTPITLPHSVVMSLPRPDSKPSSSSSTYLLVSVFENQRFIPLSGWSSSYLLPFTDHPLYSNLVGVRYPFKHLNRSLPPLGCQWLFKLQSQSQSQSQSHQEAQSNLKKKKSTFFRSSHRQEPEVEAGTEAQGEGEAQGEDGSPPPLLIGNEEMVETKEEEDLNQPEASDSLSPPVSPQEVATIEVKGLNGFEVDDAYLTTDSEGWVYAASFERFSLHLAENSSHSFRKGRDLVRRRRWIRITRLTASNS